MRRLTRVAICMYLSTCAGTRIHQCCRFDCWFALCSLVVPAWRRSAAPSSVITQRCAVVGAEKRSRAAFPVPIGMAAGIGAARPRVQLAAAPVASSCPARRPKLRQGRSHASRGCTTPRRPAESRRRTRPGNREVITSHRSISSSLPASKKEQNSVRIAPHVKTQMLIP